jgi:hypothetical protein
MKLKEWGERTQFIEKYIVENLIDKQEIKKLLLSAC